MPDREKKKPASPRERGCLGSGSRRHRCRSRRGVWQPSREAEEVGTEHAGMRSRGRRQRCWFFATPGRDPVGSGGVMDFYWAASVNAAIDYRGAHPNTKQRNPFTPWIVDGKKKCGTKQHLNSHHPRPSYVNSPLEVGDQIPLAISRPN
jgi:hypothetical protein